MKIKRIRRYESTEPVYDIEVASKDHTFYLNPEKKYRVSNCRLVNDNELFELGGQVNSFGGSALSLGSHRVCTVNMRRISLECSSYEDYKERLGKRMDDAAKILLAHRSLIKDMIDKGTQPFFDNGWLDLDRMFSTIGILGYYEANEDLKKKFGGDDYLDDLVSFIDQKARELTVSLHNIYNVEQIPAESQAVKAAKVDKWLFGEERVSENIYANQFVPLWEDVTLKEKFEREGNLASRLTGGGIIHFSLGEKVTPKQAYSIIENATACGCDYFALNANYAVCENDHYTFGKHDFCPKCLKETGKKVPIVSNLTRVVGFYTFTTNWSTEKRECDYNRRHFRGVED